MHWLTTLMYLLTFIIGIVTATVGFGIQGDIAKSSFGCSEKLQKANTGVVVLATIMLTATVVLAYCSFSCAKGSSSANAENKISKGLMVMYYGFMLLLSIVLTTLGALIKNNAKDSSKPCPKIEAKGNTLMIIGIVGICVMVGPFALKLLYHGGKGALAGGKGLLSRRGSSETHHAFAFKGSSA